MLNTRIAIFDSVRGSQLGLCAWRKMWRALSGLTLLCLFAFLAKSALGNELYSDSQTDFSEEQGANNWRYLVWDGANSVRDLTWDAPNRRWAEADGGIWIGGMHPASTTTYVVREWTSPEDGSLQVAGTGELFAEAAGVTLKILKNYDLNKPLWSADLNSNEKTEFSVKAQVKKGDTLNFVIIGRDGVGIRNDSTAWLFSIAPGK